MTEKINVNKLVELLKIENNQDLVSLIIEQITNNTVEIEDIGKVHNGYELFMSENSAFTNNELMEIQEIFKIQEIGIYGDSNIPNEKVYFHMIVSFLP